MDMLAISFFCVMVVDIGNHESGTRVGSIYIYLQLSVRKLLPNSKMLLLPIGIKILQNGGNLDWALS